MKNLFLEHDLLELRYAQRAEHLRAREFRGAVGFALFTVPATAAIAFICANYDGSERSGLLVMMFTACTFIMGMAFWVARDTWMALRAVRWRIEVLLDNVNETI